jgi:hypothetical protein
VAALFNHEYAQRPSVIAKSQTRPFVYCTVQQTLEMIDALPSRVAVSDFEAKHMTVEQCVSVEKY